LTDIAIYAIFATALSIVEKSRMARQGGLASAREESGEIQQEMNFIPILARRKFLAMPWRGMALGLDSAEYRALFKSVTWR
jgi:hypothetical protein